MAEHSAVNRRVVSSSLTCGANLINSYGRQVGARIYLFTRFTRTLDSDGQTIQPRTAASYIGFCNLRIIDHGQKGISTVTF